MYMSIYSFTAGMVVVVTNYTTTLRMDERSRKNYPNSLGGVGQLRTLES